MKKLLFAALLLAGLGSAPAAHAQLGNLVGIGLMLGANAAAKARMTPEQKAALAASQQAASQRAAAVQDSLERYATGPAIPTTLTTQRTPADKLPKKGAAQITALETELERCHAALLASPTGPVCTPAQRTLIQQAAVSVARANPNWDLHPYQQEMAFYAGEDARRQPATAPASTPN